MPRPVRLVCALAILTAALAAQTSPYGASTPPGFQGSLDSAGQLPFAGNPNFALTLRGHPNTFGGAIIFGFAPNALPISAATLLIDPSGAVVFPLPAGVTQVPLAVPATPGIVGFAGVAQVGVFDPALLGGFGLTNGVEVTVMPDRTPIRAYLPGQDFSFGANAPGIMAVLDLAIQPPAFRATGSVAFSGNISDNFPNKIAVAELSQVAYALGNGSTNQFVRAFNIVNDPTGVVTHVSIGDIPIAGTVTTIVGGRDMEVMSGGQYLFVTSGSSTVSLQVFDTSNAPFSLPTAATQTLNYANAGSGAVGLELAPQEDRLAVVISSDSLSTITIYSITIGLPQPLTPIGYLTLGAFSGLYAPSDIHFSPDGRLLFVTGSNGAYNVIDTLTTPFPTILVGNGTWPNGGSNLWCHGSAVAVQNGVPVGIIGGEGAPGFYHLVDLNVTSPTFGTVTGSFTTNPVATGINGNVSNHRMHARQSIVMAIDGTGATVDCQLVDVIDLNQPVAGGFQSWRVKMPTYTTLTPSGISCIPRDFDMY